MALNTIINIGQFIAILCRSKQLRILPTKKIDHLYEIANLVEMIAVCDILDVVTGSNSTQIPIYGKIISSRLLHSLRRIFLEDIPQIIMQLIFISRKT